MPEGRVAKLKDGRAVLSAIAGLKPGFEAVLVEGKGREIVRVHTKVSGPIRGIEVWTFVRTGDKWTDGNVPWAIGLRIYRGAVLEVFKKSGGKQLDQDSSKPDEHASVLRPLAIVSASTQPGAELTTDEAIRLIRVVPRKKPRKKHSPVLAAAAASAAAALARNAASKRRLWDAPPKFRGVLTSVSEWELKLIRAAVGASRGQMDSLKHMRRLIREIASGEQKIKQVS